MDELSFNTGDIIRLRDSYEDGWFLGELRGHVGLVPSNYVERLENSEVNVMEVNLKKVL